MEIRRAREGDMDTINRLLYQVNNVHNAGRPDLFKKDCKKYTDEELLEIIRDDERPIFVYDDGTAVLGYAFCVFQRHDSDNNLADGTTLYIDDLCVDEDSRGKRVGTALFEYVRGFAKEQGCHNLTLNVWCLNEGAMRFYEKCGLVPQKIGMELVLEQGE